MPSPDESSPLLRLSDDVLLDIRDAVKALELDSNGSGIAQHATKPLRALAQCNRRLRRLLAADTFRSVSIYRPEDWSKAHELLESILASEDVRRYTERFVVDLADHAFEDAVLKGVVIPSTFMDDLVRLLGSMTRLEHLTIHLFSHLEAIKHFEEAFDSTETVLTTVRSLAIGTDAHFLLRKCPNLRSISSQGTSQWGSHLGDTDRAFIEACGFASRLEHFEMCGRWDANTLDIVFGAMPARLSLAMPGPRYRDGLAGLIPALTKFKRLKCLLIGRASGLRLGFQEPRCGNYYKGPERAERRKRVAEKRCQAERKAAQMCFAACSALEVLWVGEQTRATVIRDAGGGVSAIDVVTGLQRSPSSSF